MVKIDILESLDNLISEARNQISKANFKKNIVKEIETIAIELASQLQERQSKLQDLLANLASTSQSDHLSAEIKNNLLKVQFLSENSILIAEQAWCKDKISYSADLEQELDIYKKYAQKEAMLIIESITGTKSFSDLANIANKIWADYDLFEQFSRAEELVTHLVRRMNEINLKNHTTHLSKDVKNTLNYVRNNIFKNSLWSNEKIEDYKNELNFELFNKKTPPFELTKTFSLAFLGMSQELLFRLKKEYFIDSKLILKWYDIINSDLDELMEKLKESDGVLILTNFEENDFIQKITAKISKLDKPHKVTNDIESFDLMLAIKQLLK